MVRDELEREQDIEELRRLALAIDAQNRILLELLARKSHEVDQLRGTSGDVQLTLKLLTELQAKAKRTQEALEKATVPKTDKKPRSSTGPTVQPQLPIVDQVFTLDDADRACPSCGGELRPMKDQFDESEMIDVIDVSYRLVKVKQQKYVCRCGGCVETALGPVRA